MKNLEMGYEHPRLWSALHQHCTISSKTVMAMFARTIDEQAGSRFRVVGCFFFPFYSKFKKLL